MKYKKELHKIKGDENTVDLQYQRTLLTKEAYVKKHLDEWNIKTWQDKGEPKSSWYPRTESMHVYGVKK